MSEGASGGVLRKLLLGIGVVVLAVFVLGGMVGTIASGNVGEAEIKVTEARGIAESNRIIAGSLTREYLQHEANQALLKFAEGDNASTVILPSGMNVTPLINANPPAAATPK